MGERRVQGTNMDLPTDPRFIDLTGKTFGRLTVDAYVGSRKRHHFWRCKCSCGNDKEINGAVLRRGDTQSCGCYRSEFASVTRLIDLTGKRFGRLVVVKRVEQTNARIRTARWLCKCDCGSDTTVDGSYLRTAATKSCGCLHRDVSGARFRTHGMTHTPEYATWRRMLMRCYNPNDISYSLYGERGIQVCDRWHNSFVAFFSDMGHRPSTRHSIGRIDSNGDYCAENCEWQTAREQATHSRTTQYVTYDGLTLTWSDWAQRLGTRASVLRTRLHKGWSLTDTLTIPVGARRTSSS